MYVCMGASITPKKFFFFYFNVPKLILFIVIKSNLCEILLN